MFLRMYWNLWKRCGRTHPCAGGLDWGFKPFLRNASEKYLCSHFNVYPAQVAGFLPDRLRSGSERLLFGAFRGCHRLLEVPTREMEETNPVLGWSFPLAANDPGAARKRSTNSAAASSSPRTVAGSAWMRMQLGWVTTGPANFGRTTQRLPQKTFNPDLFRVA